MHKEEEQICEVCARFGLCRSERDCERLTGGHINSTYRVYYWQDGEEWNCIVQRINTYVFRDPIALMENIAIVTEFLCEKRLRSGSDLQNALRYLRAKDGKYYTRLPDGSFWRCCRYIEGSTSFAYTNDLKIIEESGKAFGEFQALLTDFPVDRLHIVIPHFHNTVMRYAALRQAFSKSDAARIALAEETFRGFEKLEPLATQPYRLQREGQLPLRVTHNDTKTSNVLFEATSGRYLSVIDLDTVMPGLIAFDFGDAIRAAASTAVEDEKNTDLVAVDMDKYEAFTCGFVGKLREGLTEREAETLALGALAMTAECGVRFLTDYLEGDRYFRTEYPEHNLIRAKCQLTLAWDMAKRLEEMGRIVKKYYH